MKKRVIAMLTVLAMSMTMLVGCGATTESVTEKMSKVMAEATSTDANMKMDFSMKMTGTDESNVESSMEMAFGMNVDLQTVKESDTKSTGKVDGTVDIDLLGFQTSVPVTVYSQLDGDNVVTYSYDSDEKYWAKTSDDATDDMLSTINDMDFISITDNLELSKDKVKINDVDCYELKGSISGDEFNKIANSLTGVLDSSETGESLEDVDMSGLKADVTIYANSKTYEPVQITMDFSGSDFTSMLGDTEELLGTEVKIDIEKFEITITYNGLNSVDGIEIPEDALNAEEADDSDSNFEGKSEVKELTVEDVENPDVDEISDTEASIDDNLEWIEYVNNNFPTTFEDDTFSYQMWSFANEYTNDETCYVVEVTNITDDVIVGEGAVRAYDADGNLVDADSYSCPALSAGQSYAEVYYIDSKATNVELSMISDTVFDSDKPVDITVTEKSAEDDKIVFDVKNNASEDLNYSSIQIVFFKDGNAINNTYLYGDESTIPAGETVEMSASVYGAYDSYKIYPWGSY